MRFHLYQNCWKNIPFPLLLQKFQMFPSWQIFCHLGKKFPTHPTATITLINEQSSPIRGRFCTSPHRHLLQSLMKENSKYLLPSLMKERQKSKYQARPCQDLPESGTRWQIWPIFANFLFQRSSSRKFSILATSAPEVICDLKETKETRCDGKDRFIGDLFIQSQ